MRRQQFSQELDADSIKPKPERAKSKKGFELTDPQTRLRLLALMHPNFVRTLQALVEDWGIIVAAAIFSSWAFNAANSVVAATAYVIAAFAIGIRQRALENLIHEGVHVHLARRPWLNDIVAWTFAALPLGHNLTTERPSHMTHHKNFWDELLDPDLRRYAQLGLTRLPTSAANTAATFIKGLPAYCFGTISYFFLPADEKRALRVIRLLLWTLIIVVVIVANVWLAFVIYWLLPFLFVLTPLRLIAEASEHAALGCSTEFGTTRNNLGWTQQNFVHPHGDGYHTVHHLFTGIPWFNLARAHKILMTDPVYRTEGHHCYSLFSARGEVSATFNEFTSRS